MSFNRLPTLSVAGLRAIELTAAHEAQLQRFYEANPEYSLIVSGQAPGPGDAHDTIHDILPEGWPFTRQWVIGFVDQQQTLVAMASVVSDLLAKSVWHIGLFMVASSLQGTGLAASLYGALEAWAKSGGADWMRLGVVQGNARAERFWASMGFVETRQRSNIEMGNSVNTIRVMAKPLAGGSLDEYLDLVPRDRPST